MDGRNFDELTKRLARGASRRSLLKGLLGGIGAVAAGSSQVRFAGAQDECDSCEIPPQTTSFNRALSESCLDDLGRHYSCLCESGLCNNGDQCCNGSGCDIGSPCGPAPTTTTEGPTTTMPPCGGCPGETQDPSWTVCCPQQGGTCAQCCVDDDCGPGEICENAADRGMCVPVATTTTAAATTTTSNCIARVDCVNVQQAGCPNLCPAGSQPGNNRALEGVCCQGEGDSNGTCCSNSCTNGVCDPVVTTTTTAGPTTTTTAGPTTTTTGGPVCIENEAYCANDDECCSGCCTESVQIGVPPNRYCLPAEYCSCGTFGDSCGEIGPADARQLDCCDGLLCCHGEGRSTDSDDDDEGAGFAGESMYCAECCNDHHCGKGYHCCHGRCISDDYCCSDYDCDDCEECRYVDGYGYGYCELTGVPFGEYCGYDVQSSDGSPQEDCCDGLVCCEVDKDGNRCFECCGDWDCPKGSECKHGVCEHECAHDKECPDGTCCCKSGHCSKHCCKDKPHKHGKKPDDTGGTHVDTLPSTGSGDTANSAGWLGAAALGAAAYVVGKTVRDGVTPAESKPEE